MQKKLSAVLLLLLVLHFTSLAQYCVGDNRFTQTPFFNAADIQEDSVIYATALNWQGVNQNLKLNVFYPKNFVETLSKRPMILMIFGGAFVSGNRGQMDNYCKEFAQRGFVAVAIDYRLGKETVIPCADTLSQEKAVYRATQDAKAAMRYMVANAGTYKIDTTWLFAGGYSAGAGTANAMVYNSPAELQQVYPSIVSSLGNINTSGNSLTNTFRVKGIFNNWGGASSDFFDVNEGVPTVSFHGGNDGVVPVDSAIDVTCITTSHYIYGSHALHTKLTAAGICGDLTVYLSGGHGVYQGGAGTLMRVSRASCFFKSLFYNSCSNYAATDSLTPSCSNLSLGIRNTGFSNNFSVYPNPANNNINIITDNYSGIEIKISDLFGTTVFETKDKNVLDISQLTEGIYFIQVSQGNRFYTQKLIKQ
ncbi:MAG: T9SS type A sorting domain-containing protein [Bacteroidetes bacterium]|nr:T9SS type A sorting domain-containing protein [Bacteroidota bacterium]